MVKESLSGYVRGLLLLPEISPVFLPGVEWCAEESQEEVSDARQEAFFYPGKAGAPVEVGAKVLPFEVEALPKG